MNDLFYLAVTAGMFALLFGLVRGLERLRAGVGDE